MKREVHIAVAFDQNYSKYFYVVASSVFDKHERGSVVFHAIITGLNDAESLRVKKFVEDAGQSIHFYQIDASLVSGFVTNGKWTTAAYYRLFFSSVVPADLDRILYLDMDTIVTRNLQDFYSLPLDGCPVGAVYDVHAAKQPLIGIDEEGEYFNSGVLLIDLQQWRTEQISEKAMDYLNRYPERIRYVDQCALNAVLKGRWKKLDIHHNLMYSWVPDGLSGRALRKFLKDTYVVHYTLQRPWHMLCKNRLRYLYARYYRRSALLQKGPSVIDFSYSKIPAWLKIRFYEFYFDLPFVPQLWRRLKSLRS